MAKYEDGYDAQYGYNHHTFAHPTLPLKVVGFLVRNAVAGPIALASEAVAAYKAEKRTGGGDCETEAEAEAEVEIVNIQSPAVHNIPSNATEGRAALRNKLPYPVILPQRRPGTKTRDFVHAYAPVLQNHDIDQAAFISFLEDFHKASQASPVFDVILLWCGIAGLYPNGIAQAVTLTVGAAAMVGQEVQQRWQVNRFLDQANREVFVPRGLYVLVVKYEPSKEDSVGRRTVDLGAVAVVKYGDGLLESGRQGCERSKMDGLKRKVAGRLRVASGETQGEVEVRVNCAPLVFEDREGSSRGAENESKMSSLKAHTKEASRFVQDYFDRGAQATFVSLQSSRLVSVAFR
jgi:hypothetical protein